MPPMPKAGMVGMVNPVLAKADFSQPVHPYQSYYVAPNHHPAGQNQFNHY